MLQEGKSEVVACNQPLTMPASGECIMTLDGHEDWVRWDRTGVFHIGETFRLRFGGGGNQKIK